MTVLPIPAPPASIPTAASLRRAVLRHIAPVVHACGVDDHEVSCALFGDVHELRVEIHGPSALRTVDATIAVRVLDAVHAHEATIGRVTVVVLD